MSNAELWTPCATSHVLKRVLQAKLPSFYKQQNHKNVTIRKLGL